jgi:hypothetical protein
VGRKKKQQERKGDSQLPESFPVELLQQSTGARQAYFEHCLIEHTHLQEACNAVVRAICMPGNDGAYRRLDSLVLIIGPSRVGKTTLIHLLEQELLLRAQERMQADPGYIPYVSITMDGADRFDWKDYCQPVLKALSDPFLPVKKPARSARDMQEAMQEAFVFRQTGVVIVDEAQHLAKAGSGRRLQDRLDHLKHIENKTGVSHVLVGTYEMRPFRKVNAQLACRSIDVHFKRYDATNEVECTTFQSVLWALQRQLPVECEPQLLQNHWEFLYARSLGCVGLLKQHLNEALRLALDEGAQTVTLDHLRKTALHKEKVDLALEAILKGEQDFAEAPDADQDLLIKLGMAPAKTPAEKENTGVDGQQEVQPHSPHRQKRQPGERRPGRDSIGSEPRYQPNDEVNQAVG